MAQDWAKAFYASGRWLACRESFIQERIGIDGGLCQDCQDSLGEIAHHWPVPLTAANIQDAEISLSHSNLRWVCRHCHDLYPGHGVAKALTPLVAFDDNGDVIPPYRGIVCEMPPDRRQPFGECTEGREGPLGCGENGGEENFYKDPAHGRKTAGKRGESDGKEKETGPDCGRKGAAAGDLLRHGRSEKNAGRGTD